MSIRKIGLPLALIAVTPLQSCEPATIALCCAIITAAAAATTIIVFLERDEMVIEVNGVRETRTLTPRDVREIKATGRALIGFDDGTSGVYPVTVR